MEHRDQGFSTIKFLAVVCLIAIPLWYAWLLVPVYSTKWKVEEVFETISRTMAMSTEEEIRLRLPRLLDVKYIEPDDLPQSFYSNLEIQADGSRVSISTIYDVTIWPLGPVEDTRDWQGHYDVKQLGTMDRWRHLARLDFEFAPHAETP